MEGYSATTSSRFKEDLRSWINLDPRDGDPEVDPRARPVDLQQ